MKTFDRVGFYLCYVLLFIFFWMFGVMATGVVIDLAGITTFIDTHVPNYVLVDGWLTATGGTFISIGFLKWIMPTTN